MGRYSGMWTSCSFLFHSSVMGACWGVFRLLRKSPWLFFKWNWMVLCDTKLISEEFLFQDILQCTPRWQAAMW
jgi:hypothetical protein